MTGVLRAKVDGTWVDVIGTNGLDTATADTRYVNVTGDTMTGDLTTTALHSPRIESATSIAMATEGVDRLTVGKTPGGTDAVTSTVPLLIYPTTGSTALQMRSSTYPSGPIIWFQNADGSVGAAYIGVQNGVMNVAANVSGGLPLHMQSPDEVSISSNGAFPVRFGTNTFERGRFTDGGMFLVAKTDTSLAVPGFSAQPGGYTAVTTDGASAAALRLNHVTGSTVVYTHYMWNGTAIGSVNRNGTNNGVVYGTTSDYRVKYDDGPITDAVARVSALRPIRFRWRSHPDNEPEDGFLAHEVQEVVPEAVSGAKDEVLQPDDPRVTEGGEEAGTMILQGLDTGRLVPLLTAAVQELAARLNALEVTVG